MWNIYLYFIILKLFTNFQNIIFGVKIVANASLNMIICVSLIVEHLFKMFKYYGTTDYNHVRYLKFSRSEWLFLTPSGKFVCYLHIMARTSYMSTRWWWCPLCIRLVWFMEFNATFNNISVFVLYQQAWLNWMLLLAHWNNRSWVDMSYYSDTLSWTNQSYQFTETIDRE
jgi:hypothetical protein